MKLVFFQPDQRRFDLQLAFAFAFSGLGAYAAFLALLKPGVVCWLHALTGLPCLTCGATRAAASFLRLDIAGAFAWNPLVATLSAAAFAFTIYVFAARWFALPRFSVMLAAADRRPLALAAGAVLLANWSYLLVTGV